MLSGVCAQSNLKKCVMLQHTPSEVFHYTDSRGQADAPLPSKTTTILQAAKKDLQGIIQLQVSFTSDQSMGWQLEPKNLVIKVVSAAGPQSAGGQSDPPPCQSWICGGSSGRPGDHSTGFLCSCPGSQVEPSVEHSAFPRSPRETNVYHFHTGDD